MTRLKLELPPQLALALQSRQIDEEQAKQIALAALELSAERGIGPLPPSPAKEAAAFARTLIDDNRALFEELAKR